jgi:hypothetical protein
MIFQSISGNPQKMTQILITLFLSLYPYQVDSSIQKTTQPVLKYYNADQFQNFTESKPCFIWTQQKVESEKEFGTFS